MVALSDPRGRPRTTATTPGRSQSEVVGVLLFTAVVILLVSVVGLFVLGGADTTSEPVSDVEISVGPETVELAHNGGDSLDESAVRVNFGRDGDGSATLADWNDTDGDGDVRFEAGERRERTHGASGVLSVTVVHVPTNTVLARDLADVPSAGAAGSLAWRTAADWDAAVAEHGVVHASYGDHDAGRIELGAPVGDAVGYWPLDEDGGSSAGDVAGSNDGTIQGATPGGSGIAGTTSYAFDGSGDHVDGATGDPALRNTGSVAAWIRTTATGADTPWQAPGLTGVESAGDGDDVFWGWIDGGGRVGIQTGNSPAARSTTAVDDGAWHHVVLTRDAATGRVEVYVDGSLEDATTSRTGEITTTFDSIGRIEATGATFDGRIDEFRVYDRVLSGGEASDLHDAATTGSLTTATKTVETARDVSDLSLTDVDATDHADVTVTVGSDPNGDGTFEETSDPIVLDGSETHSVSGLSTDSRHFRLQFEFASSDVTASPTVGGVALVGGE